MIFLAIAMGLIIVSKGTHILANSFYSIDDKVCCLNNSGIWDKGSCYLSNECSTINGVVNCDNATKINIYCAN